MNMLLQKMSMLARRKHCFISTSVTFIKRFRSTLQHLPPITGKQPDSYYHRPALKPLVATTLGRLLDLGPERFGDELAVVDRQPNIRKTYVDLKEEANKLACGLLALNLRKGDRVAIWSPNRYEFILTQMAAAKAGLILVTINPAYQAPELDYSLTKVGVKALIFPEAFHVQDYYKIICSLAPEISESKPGFIETKRFPHLESLIVMSDKIIPGTFRLNDVMNAGGSDQSKALDDLQRKIKPDDDATIIFTSGTTGKPKAALLSHFTLVNSCASYSQLFRYFDEKHRVCCQVPLFHVFGGMLGGLVQIVSGATCVFPSPEYNPQKALLTIETEKCTMIYGTPTMFIDLIRHPNFPRTDISSLRAIFGGGARFTPELVRQLYSAFPKSRILIGYGSTESACKAAGSEFDRSWTELSQMDHTGQISENVEVKVVNSENQMVSMGSDGEICCRGFFLMKEYWEDEEKTKETIRNGWYHTGDLGSLTADGYVTIKGRIKDIIIRGGENINPKEIEDVLVTHPEVVDAQVFGVEDERLGEDVCVWIKLTDNSTLSAEQVKEFCRGKMAHYKIPRHIRFVIAFPTTLSGKVQKFLMQEEMTKTLYSKAKNKM